MCLDVLVSACACVPEVCVCVGECVGICECVGESEKMIHFKREKML